jgi:hypothetical protein
MLLGSFDPTWNNDESGFLSIAKPINIACELSQVNLNLSEHLSSYSGTDLGSTQDTSLDENSPVELLKKQLPTQLANNQNTKDKPLSTEINPAQFPNRDGIDSPGEFRLVPVKESKVASVPPEEPRNDEPTTILPGSDAAGSINQNILEMDQEILGPETMDMDVSDKSGAYDHPAISSVNKGPTKRRMSVSEQIDPDSKHGEIQSQFEGREKATPSLGSRECSKKGDVNVAASAASDLQTHVVDRFGEEADNIPKDFLNDIMPIPRSLIRFETRPERNSMNAVKSWIEDATGQEWDWWPLSPRRPPLAFCTFRVSWKCVREFLFIGFGTMLRYSSSVE